MSIKCFTSSLTQMLSPICFLVVIVSTGYAQSNGPFAAPPTAHALAATSSLEGTVVDEQDAVVPDAAVFVTDVTGKLKTEVITNHVGSFVVQLPAPGHYTVTVKHQGFIAAEIQNVILKVNDRLALRIQLMVGSVGETVTVEARGGSLRHAPAIVTGFDAKLVENLPLNGRTLQPLIWLTPGTVLTKSTFTEQGQFSVNGQRANANYIMVDGVSANIGVAAGAGLGQSGSGALPALGVLGATNSLVSVDALQEFKIQTSSYAPEFGRTPGGQISISTRAGTNRFRGTLFEYFRHDALEANDWFANRDLQRSPGLRHHDFGGVIGGPLIKDRTFFFLSYEGVRLSSPQVATKEVPSMAARDAAPTQIRAFLQAFPVPNGEKTKDGLAKFTASYSEPATLNATGLRVDHNLSGTLTLFARFNYAPSSMTQRGVSSSLNNSLLSSFNPETLTAGATLALSSGIHNDFRVNYSRTRAQKSFLLDDLGGAVIPDDSTLFPFATSHHDSMFGFSIGNGSSFSIGRDIDNLQRQLNLVNNLSILKGTHTLKLGIDYRRLLPIYGQRKYNQVATFNGVAGALKGTASSVSVVTQDRVALVFANFSTYVQDTWRVTRRMTLTYGLRWEFNPPPSGREGKSLLTALGLDAPTKLSLAPLGTPHYKPGYNNFAPRAAVAYQLSQRQGKETVLRAGFGIFYDLGAGMIANSASYFPYLRRKNFFNVSYPLDASAAKARPLSFDPPFSTVRVFEPNFKLPFTAQWNVSVEQSLGSSQTISTSYVGAAGRRLLRSELLLNPNPNFQQVFVATDNASSDYHALQVQFQRRLSKRLQAMAAYTWSHSIDINSNDSFNNPPAEKYELRLDRGPSDFDVRHSFGAAVTWELPTINIGALGKRLVRNWSLDAMLIARTATPVDIVNARDIGFGLLNFRPDRVAGVPLYMNDHTAPGGRIINRAAFSIPQTPRQGALGRNSLRGFPVSQVNLALRRRLKLNEQFNLQFRAEFINLFNHPNFGDPVGDLGSGLFGFSPSMFGRSLGSGGTNGGLSPLYQVGGPRSIQLALKMQF
ncbi:MAG: carboxypeptidase regulatory-like domain-containing protein [Acidobacteriota bacterium]|nr:carboxypeptidase regulatory-like domain-containing protein [Acidobacteriota bacterium]